MGLENIEEEFLSELIDVLEATESILLVLEKEGFEAESYNVVMRNLHNLKGTTAALELDYLSNVVHSLETFFLNGKDALPNTVDVLLKSFSFIYSYFHDGDSEHLKNINLKPNGKKEEAQELVTKNNPGAKVINLRVSQEAFYKNEVDIRDLKVFHIDDEPGTLDLIKGDLEEWGLHVESFLSLDKLRDYVINNGLPDCFLIDYKLKDITGIEILKNLNLLVPSIPKIIYSGFIDQNLMLQALHNGAFGIIEKPFTEDLFREYLKLVKKKKVRDGYLKKSHQFQLKVYNDLIKGNFDKSVILESLEALMDQAEGVGFKKSQ